MEGSDTKLNRGDVEERYRDNRIAKGTHGVPANANTLTLRGFFDAVF